MDLATIERVLKELYQREPHLPRPADLARTVLAAYHHADLSSDSPRHLAAVVAALWPIGAAAGAAHGHAVTVGAIRGEIAQALADPSPDPRGRWVVAGMAQAADDLPHRCHPDRCTVAQAGPTLGSPRRLDQALTVGLANAWRAGHFDATERALTRFTVAVVDLVGPDRLTTTFLIPTLPAYALLEEIGYAAYRIAEADREHPTPQPPRSGPPEIKARAVRPAASRAFVALRRVHPNQRIPTSARRSTGPGRPGPGR